VSHLCPRNILTLREEIFLQQQQQPAAKNEKKKYV